MKPLSTYFNAPICRACAEARGWKPVGHPVGQWRAVCVDCGKVQDVTAVRDWRQENAD